ncbi:MAG: ADP-ribosylglycohydrolase family protein [Alphaproteobacteria bacterium]|nr:ADP-ribosylglycohydrolase family protein [Alphaproteobacteria bacterium]
MSAQAMLERAQGCLFGLLAGDSLGGLVEFKDPEEIAGLYPQGVRVMEQGGTWDLAAGQPTDDGELALALARALVEAKGYDAEVAAQAYARWIDSEPFDCGNSIGLALRAAARAAPGDRALRARAAANPESQANGALMRVAPIGIAHAGNPAAAARAAAFDAELTHPNGVTVAANRAFAAAIATLVAGGDGAQALASAGDCVGSGDGAEIVRGWLAEAAIPDLADCTRQMGWVRHAFRNATARLASGQPIGTAIAETIARGGDTDTNAAICGALLGAAQGVGALPLDWLETLKECRPGPGSDTAHTRPPAYWPAEAGLLAEILVGLAAR